ncbi:hypothetical protein CT0861_09449, partial [Colletotrichum tofieldiae]
LQSRLFRLSHCVVFGWRTLKYSVDRKFANSPLKCAGGKKHVSDLESVALTVFRIRTVQPSSNCRASNYQRAACDKARCPASYRFATRICDAGMLNPSAWICISCQCVV